MNVAALKAALLASRATIDSVLAQLDVEQAASSEWLSVRDAAKRLGKSPDVIRSMVTAGTLEAKRTEGGGKIYVKV